LARCRRLRLSKNIHVQSAGLALKGCQPFAYIIATFSLYCPFEMVRDDLGYQNLPVMVAGMGPRVIDSTLGGTHHTMEDVAVASAIPNFRVLAPCDPLECIDATRWCAMEILAALRQFVNDNG
jgi:transketolase